MATEEEVAAAKTEVAKLRTQLQGLRLGDNLAEASNDIALVSLAAEAVRLRLQIDSAKDRTRKSTIKEGASQPLAAAKAELAQAVSAEKATKAAAKSEGSEN